MNNITKYFSIDGYATRSEYWGTLIISVIVSLLLAFVYGMLGGFWGFYDHTQSVAIAIIILANSWVWVATTVRRCRDADINPWFALLTILPYIGAIATIVFGCLQSAKRGD